MVTATSYRPPLSPVVIDYNQEDVTVNDKTSVSSSPTRYRLTSYISSTCDDINNNDNNNNNNNNN